MLCVFSCTYWPVAHLLFRNVYSQPFLIFLLCYLFFILSCNSYLYSLYTRPLLGIWFFLSYILFLNILFHYEYFIMNIFTKNVCVWILLCYWEDIRGFWGFSGGTSGKEPAYECRSCKRPTFYPWVRKIPCRRAWQPTPTFLTGETPGLWSLVGYDP